MVTIDLNTGSEWVAIAALAISLISLAWNIIKDLIKDRVEIELALAVGDEHRINGTTGAVFSDTGSLTNLPINPHLLVQIINKGGKNVYVYRIEGKFKNAPVENKPRLTLVVSGLPRKLEPYEVFSQVVNIHDNFKKEILEDNIEELWVEDTKGKKWKLSSNGWERLEKTMKDAFEI